MSLALPATTEHALFLRFPLIGVRRTTAGDAPTPYHIYDGTATLVGGKAPLDAVKPLLEREELLPLTDSDGMALVAVWLIDAPSASLGPHKEVQISLAVTRSPVAPVDAHPLALVQALVQMPEVRLLCHGLWNDTPLVVAYNREVLGLDARLMEASIAVDEANRRFSASATEAADAQPVLTAEVRLLARSSHRATRNLLLNLGLRSAFALSREPWITAQVLNPRGPVIPFNAGALVFIGGESVNLDLWDPAADRLEIQAAPWANLGFRPEFVEQFRELRFVYLNPYNDGYRALEPGERLP